MTWWLFNKQRLAEEEQALAELEKRSSWLTVHEWAHKKDVNLYVDLNIQVDENNFELLMIYPSIFPDAPPMLVPKNPQRLSQHQYGADGELCLEHRPDNWDPSITGAHMVQSAYRLLTEERLPTEEARPVPNAHSTSLGQRTRRSNFRLLLDQSDIEFLNTLPPLVPHDAQFDERSTSGVYISALRSVGTKDAPIWNSQLQLANGGTSLSGTVVRIPDVDIGEGTTHLELAQLFLRHNIEYAIDETVGSKEQALFLVGNDRRWHLFWIYVGNKGPVTFNYSPIEIPAPQNRTPEEPIQLSEKSVAIIGCGSLGSKIAASLARSGIAKFLLIDEDLFFPGNVTRNELDLADIGTHKVDALRQRLLRINPDAHILTRSMNLGGQESSSSLTSALEQISDCNLIVDATANAAAFNPAASIARRSNISMVWSMVYARGIGGFIARSRPKIDATPHETRRQMEVWYDNHGAPWTEASSQDYGATEGEATPQIAYDADVGIIASYTARLAIDTLQPPEESHFPYSVYIIGLAEEWIFSAPFDTRPLEILKQGSWGEEDTDVTIEDLRALLVKYAKKESPET